MIGHFSTLLFIGGEPEPETQTPAQSSAGYDDDSAWWNLREERRKQDHNNAAAINLILALAASGALN